MDTKVFYLLFSLLLALATCTLLGLFMYYHYSYT